MLYVHLLQKLNGEFLSKELCISEQKFYNNFKIAQRPGLFPQAYGTYLCHRPIEDIWTSTTEEDRGLGYHV